MSIYLSEYYCVVSLEGASAHLFPSQTFPELVMDCGPLILFGVTLNKVNPHLIVSLLF